MIGKYLGTLTPVEEDRVLTQSIEPLDVVVRIKWGVRPFYKDSRCGCLMSTAQGNVQWHAVKGVKEPGWRYEYLCHRFGPERVNRAIRSRLLSNQARRMLQHQGSRKQETAPACQD